MTLDVLIAHEGAREAVLPRCSCRRRSASCWCSTSRCSGRQAPALLGARGHDPGRAARADRAAQIERNGRTWPAPLEYWKAALEHMVQLRDQAKLQLPLKSHGYLLEVIVGMGDKAERRPRRARAKARRPGPATRRVVQAGRRSREAGSADPRRDPRASS
jgi:hypothetical protein